MSGARLCDLEHPDWIVRERAVLACDLLAPSARATNGRDLIERLLDVAEDPVKQVRAAVARKLGAAAHTPLGKPLRERITSAFHDDRWRVRFAAVRAYGSLSKHPHEPLIPLVADDAESVRWAAVRTLAEWPLGATGSGVDALLRALADPAPTVRAAAAWGLAHTTDERGVVALDRAVRDPDYRVRRCAALVSDRRAVPTLVAALGDHDMWVRVYAVRNLGALRASEAVEPILVLLRDKSRYVRADALRALAEVGDPRASDEISALLRRSTDRHVRATARATLRAIKRARRRRR